MRALLPFILGERGRAAVIPFGNRFVARTLVFQSHRIFLDRREDMWNDSRSMPPLPHNSKTRQLQNESTLENKSMDRIVGDDIASGIRQVVHQLLTLASDPDSQQIMAKQPGTIRRCGNHTVEFISGLVTYMSDEDEEVRLMATRALEFLSTNPANKSILVNHPGLVEKMVVPCFGW